ncbi:MAG: hypothetical protein ABI811_06690 [Acidobacteriota bacterium]
MRLKNLALSLLFLAAPAFSQTAVTVALSGNAFITTGTNFGLNGTATLSGTGLSGTAILSGAGNLDRLISGQSSGAVNATFTLVFPAGEVIYGTIAVPAGYLVPQIGGTAIAGGTVTITGGTGKYEGTRAVLTSVTGSGTATGETTTTFIVNGSGQVSIARKVLPQLAFGGGWYTALYFSNAGIVPASLTVSFFADNGTPLNIAALGGTSTTVNIPAGGSVRIEAPNSGALQQGYVTVTLPENVSGYGVFRQSVAGTPDQEAVVPLANAAGTSSSFIFDDTNFISAAAIVNASSVDTTVTVTAKSANGGVLGTGTITLAAKNKTAVALRSIPGLSGVANSRGTVTFTVTTGSVSALGLRFYGSAFTSIPAADK